MLRTVAAAVLSLGLIAATASAACAQGSRQISQAAVGPWAVHGWLNQAGAPYCTAERKVGDVSVVFARFVQGYALALQSPHWWLAPGGTALVRVHVANVRDATVAANVLSSNLIMARLTADPADMRRLVGAPAMVVTASDQTFTVPLDQFGEALAALDACLQQAQRQAAPPAPAVPPGHAPAAPGQSPTGPGIPTVVPATISGLTEGTA